MSDKFTDSEVEAVIHAAISELLNIAAQVAELQQTDEGADEIYAVCDLVAEFYQIERARAVTTEHDDGSFTTHFEQFTGSGDMHRDVPIAANSNIKRQPIPGSIRTVGKPKLRLVDSNTPVVDDDDDDDDNI